jgi:hypothetical protein
MTRELFLLSACRVTEAMMINTNICGMYALRMGEGNMCASFLYARGFAHFPFSWIIIIMNAMQFQTF